MTSHHDVAGLLLRLRDRVHDASMDHERMMDDAIEALETQAKALSEAEAERDDALGRVDELELNAETISDEFEKDCWKAMRRVLALCKFDWRDVMPDGLTADDAFEYIKESIENVDAALERAQARALAAEARLAEAMKVIEPFVALVEAIECTTLHAYSDDETWPLDNGANIVKIGHLRAARAFTEAAKEKT